MSYVDEHISPDGAFVGADARHVRRRVSWGALLSGVVIAFAVQLLLTLLGGAIGFGSVGETGSSSGATTLRTPPMAIPSPTVNVLPRKMTK